MLAGRDSLAGIFRWGRRLRPKALEELGIRVGQAPCHATYHYVFRSLTVDDLEAALGAWVRDDAALGHAAIDGKSLRGSRDCEVSAVHLLAAFCARLKAVVGELRVPPDGNEITATAVDMWTTRCREFPHIPSAQQQPFPFEFRWQTLARAHWGIENRLHLVRDVTLREDACRVRSGLAPQALAALRNLVPTLTRRLGYQPVEGREHFAEHRAQAIRLIRNGIL